MKKTTSIFLIIILWVPFFACKKAAKINPSFYLWKQTASLSSNENILLKKLKVQCVYIKYFDVVVKNNLIVPDAIVKLDTSILQSRLQIIPVVYITQQAINNSHVSDSLAEKIVKLCDLINQKNGIQINELQIDCDWTATNQHIYFTLLKNIQSQVGNSITISTTIRLHQIKYPNKTGIPPAKKGMLMFYNMGDLKNIHSRNTIYNEEDAKKYITYLKKYPIKLDIALPIYSWAIQYRNNNVVKIHNRLHATYFSDTTFFNKIDNNHLISKQSTLYKGMYYLKGDIIKIEGVNADLCNEAASLLSKHIPLHDRTIVFFDLDKNNTHHYTHETFYKILQHFN